MSAHVTLDHIQFWLSDGYITQDHPAGHYLDIRRMPMEVQIIAVDSFLGRPAYEHSIPGFTIVSVESMDPGPGCDRLFMSIIFGRTLSLPRVVS